MSTSFNICKKLTDLCRRRQLGNLISSSSRPAEDLSYLQPLPWSGSECRQAPARCSLLGAAPKLNQSSRGEHRSLGTLHFRAMPCSHLSLLKCYSVRYTCLVAYFLGISSFLRTEMEKGHLEVLLQKITCFVSEKAEIQKKILFVFI